MGIGHKISSQVILFIIAIYKWLFHSFRLNTKYTHWFIVITEYSEKKPSDDDGLMGKKFYSCNLIQIDKVNKKNYFSQSLFTYYYIQFCFVSVYNIIVIWWFEQWWWCENCIDFDSGFFSFFDSDYSPWVIS